MPNEPHLSGKSPAGTQERSITQVEGTHATIDELEAANPSIGHVEAGSYLDLADMKYATISAAEAAFPLISNLETDVS